MRNIIATETATVATDRGTARPRRVATSDVSPRQTCAAYVSNILSAYGRATARQITAGRDWYPAAARIVAAIGNEYAVAADTVAAVVAALSPRNPWTWNIADADAFVSAYVAGKEMPRATTFGCNRRRAWDFLAAIGDWTSTALKVRSFIANILGDENAVTVDVWAIRVATDGILSAVKNDAQYHAVEAAYRAAAEVVGETPRDLQAIVWVVAQAESMGQSRPQAVRRPKAGTSDFIRALVAVEYAV